MICISDNDVLRKLASCDLLDEAISALRSAGEDVYILPTFKYALRKPATIKSLGEAALDRLTEFIGRVRELSLPPDPEEMEVFSDITGIDPGEAVLFSASHHFSDFVMITGDKICLRALWATANCESDGRAVCAAVCDRLTEKVVCFEQIICRTIVHYGFAHIRSKVALARNCDIALRCIFSSGTDTSEIDADCGLKSYIAELRSETGRLLAPH
jgi:hypothetical protein